MRFDQLNEHRRARLIRVADVLHGLRSALDRSGAAQMCRAEWGAEKVPLLLSGIWQVINARCPQTRAYIID